MDFVEPEDVHAIVMPSDFDIAIAGSVPLIHDFYDVDPTLAPIKTLGNCAEIRMKLDLNAHQLIHGIRGRDSVLILTKPDVVHSSAVPPADVSACACKYLRQRSVTRMMRGLHNLWAILLALRFIGAPPLAQAQLSENPITPGFWSFANRKSETTEDVKATCRDYIEIRFADGHYIGLRIYKTESGVAVREVGEVGRCTFNRETQVEHCDKRLIKPDGSIMLGTTESRYSFADGKTLKMTVTPKMVTDTPFTNAPFDAFPVHCPDDVVWSILNEVGRSR